MKHLILWGFAGVALGYFLYSTLLAAPVVGGLYTSVSSAAGPAQG